MTTTATISSLMPAGEICADTFAVALNNISKLDIAFNEQLRLESRLEKFANKNNYYWLNKAEDTFTRVD